MPIGPMRQCLGGFGQCQGSFRTLNFGSGDSIQYQNLKLTADDHSHDRRDPKASLISKFQLVKDVSLSSPTFVRSVSPKK
jgi:hypothetical protein